MKRIFSSQYLLIFPVISLGISIFLLITGYPISSDGIQYSDLGYNLLHHASYQSSRGVIPGWVQPPVFPFFCGIFTLFLPVQIAGYILSLILSAFILYLIYIFLCRHFSEQMAYITIALLAINPLFLITNLRVLSETLFAIFNILLFIQLYQIVQLKQNKRYLQIGYISILSVIQYLIRPEGIFYIIVIFILLTGYLRFKKAVVYLVMCTVLLIPYGLFIKSLCGSFNIFPKFTYNLRLGTVGSSMGYEPSIDLQKDGEFVRSMWFAYDSEHNTTYDTQIMDAKFYASLNEKVADIKKSESRFTFMLKKVMVNITELIRVFIKSSAIPILLLILFLIGLLKLFRKNRQLLLLLFIWVLPAFYFLISHVEERFLFTLLPYIVFVAAMGVIAISEKVKKKGTIIILLALVLINSSYYYYQFYNDQKRNIKYHAISESLKNEIETKTSICMKSFHITFFGGFNYLKLPICRPDELLKYLRKYNTHYLMLGNEVLSSHRTLLEIYNQKIGSFTLVKTWIVEDTEFKIFRLSQ